MATSEREPHGSTPTTSSGSQDVGGEPPQACVTTESAAWKPGRVTQRQGIGEG
jgi:hypothetical protein